MEIEGVNGSYSGLNSSSVSDVRCGQIYKRTDAEIFVQPIVVEAMGQREVITNVSLPPTFMGTGYLLNKNISTPSSSAGGPQYIIASAQTVDPQIITKKNLENYSEQLLEQMKHIGLSCLLKGHKKESNFGYIQTNAVRDGILGIIGRMEHICECLVHIPEERIQATMYIFKRENGPPIPCTLKYRNEFGFAILETFGKNIRKNRTGGEIPFSPITLLNSENMNSSITNVIGYGYENQSNLKCFEINIKKSFSNQGSNNCLKVHGPTPFTGGPIFVNHGGQNILIGISNSDHDHPGNQVGVGNINGSSSTFSSTEGKPALHINLFNSQFLQELRQKIPNNFPDIFNIPQTNQGTKRKCGGGAMEEDRPISKRQRIF